MMELFEWARAFYNVNKIFPTLLLWAIGILLAYYMALRSPETRKIGLAAAGAIALGALAPASLATLGVLAGIVFVFSRKGWLQNKTVIAAIFFTTIALLIGTKDVARYISGSSAFVLLGSSYYLFRLLSFALESYKGKAGYAKYTVTDYLVWIFFPPVLMAGPIIRFHELYVTDVSPSISKINGSIFHFTVILIVKLILVDLYMFRITYEYALGTARDTQQALPLLLFGIFAFLHAYLDLMLYTEMSKAAARFFGFSTVENFNRPLLATNISQFWQRWHMSLSNWTRDYVFFPVLLKTKKAWVASYASMLMIGIWHSFSLNWLVWALCHGTALNAYSWLRTTEPYRALQPRRAGKILLRLSGTVFVFCFTSSVFIFVAFSDYKQPFELIRNCFRYYWG